MQAVGQDSSSIVVAQSPWIKYHSPAVTSQFYVITQCLRAHIVNFTLKVDSRVAEGSHVEEY
jgi:hypothetical protein